MKTLLIALLLTLNAQACSVTQEWKASSVEDQVKYAGAIIRGRVANVIGDINRSSVVFNDVIFYRGSGPSEITVHGFSNDALCSISPPELDTEAFVFLCRKDREWTINKINLFTGSVMFNANNEEIVENGTADEWRSENSQRISYMKCGKPPKEDLVREPIVLRPRIPIEVIPEPHPIEPKPEPDTDDDILERIRNRYNRKDYQITDFRKRYTLGSAQPN